MGVLFQEILLNCRRTFGARVRLHPDAADRGAAQPIGECRINYFLRLRM